MEIILEAGRTEKNYWSDLWRYRELFQVLARRDIAVRYKQTVLGVAWALIRPLATMAVFTVVFGRIAGLPSEGGAPYALMVFAGLLPWTFFSTALADASNSLLGSSQLISKVYFPRLIVPAASIGVAITDLLISLGLLAGLMAWHQFVPGWQIVLLPAWMVLAVIASLGPSLWISALNVKYRDFRYVLPFLLQLGLYVSPVAFSSGVVPDQWRLVYALNPLVAIIDGFRWSLLGGAREIYIPGLAISLFVLALFLWLGVKQFRKVERTFADVI